jgi:hypothetical protein
MSATVIDHPVASMAPAKAAGWARRRVDRAWWRTATYDGRLLVEALRRRDIAMIFRALKSRGWSSAAIAAATGLSENRVRAVLLGRQVVTSYDVFERIALGLNIDRGLMGLAYTTV